MGWLPYICSLLNHFSFNMAPNLRTRKYVKVIFESSLDETTQAYFSDQNTSINTVKTQKNLCCYAFILIIFYKKIRSSTFFEEI